MKISIFMGTKFVLFMWTLLDRSQILKQDFQVNQMCFVQRCIDAENHQSQLLLMC